MIAWLALFWLAFASAPTIQQVDAYSPEKFVITFEPGAVWACTIYRMTVATEEKDQNFPDGHYAPRHCWSLEATNTSYEDDWQYIRRYDADWDVWAEIQYPEGGEYPAKSTNRMRVHR